MVRYTNIIKAIEDYIEKCAREGPTSTGGIIYPVGETPTFEPKGKKLTKKELDEIADKMAERWGLEVSVVDGKREVNGRKFVLWDDEHKTVINLSTLIQRQDEIDFTNRGYYNTENGGTSKSTYTLDDFLGYYNEMPTMMKDATGGIIVQGSGNAHNCLNEFGINNPIVLTHKWFRGKWVGAGSINDVQQCMYHEGGHAIENMYYNPPKSTDRYVFSNTSNYEVAMNGNRKKFASNYAKRTYRKRVNTQTHRRRCEDFAETMSMVAMSKTSTSSNANMDGAKIDEFKRDHETTWALCENILDGKVKPNDFEKLS